MAWAIISIVAFCLGFVAGAHLRGAAFGSQDWRVMRWSEEVLGYRPMSFGSIINKDDKVIMALHLDTDYFPRDGIKYTQQ